MIEYEFTDNLVKGEVRFGYILGLYSWYRNDEHYLPDYSYPLAIKKSVKSDTTTLPQQSYAVNFKYLDLNFYSNVDFSKTMFFFDQVKVDNPEDMEDETFYFSRGRLTSHAKGIIYQIQAWDYDQNRLTKTATYRNGIIQTETEYQSYDSYNNPLRILTRKGTTDFIRQENTYYIDTALNSLHAVKTSKATDIAKGTSRSQTISYNSKGKPEAIYEGESASPETQIKALTYDSFGQVANETSFGPNGNSVQTYTYSQTASRYIATQSLNGKAVEQQFDLNTGQLVQSKDLNGQVTTQAYDDYGRPTVTSYPDNQQKTIQYAIDLKTTTVTAGGRTVSSTLDTFGRTILVDYPEGEEDTKTDYTALGAVSKIYKKQSGNWVQKKSYEYDSKMRMIQSISADFGTTVYAYDDLANTVTVTDPKGRSVKKTANELGQTTDATGVDNTTVHSDYDAFGNLLKLTDPRNLVRQTDYDAYGRVTAAYHPSASGATPVKQNIPMYTNGAITQSQTFGADGQAFHTYAFTYDTEGRLTQTSVGGVAVETLTYDESGHGGSAGRLTTAENKADGVKTRYDYDSFGRPIKETTTLATLSNKTYTIQTQYHPVNGNVSATLFPDGKAISYGYDATQRVNAISYDSKSIAGYSYNPNGTVKQITYGNGFTIQYSYTKEVLLTEILYKDKTGAQQFKQTYSYDELGNLQSTWHSDYGNYSPGGITRKYAYDVKDELTSVAINDAPTYTHSYDANGNPIRFETPNNKGLSGNNITVDFNADKITEKRQIDGSKTQFEYDAEGNMTRKQRFAANGNPEKDIRYSYNYQGQLQESKDSTITTGTYRYNHKRQRVYSDMRMGTSTGDGIKWYYWDAGGRNIGEGHQRYGDYTVRYIYSGNEKIAMARPKDLDNMAAGEEILYFINNAQGTPVMVVNEAGTVESRINMDEWGNLGDNTDKSEVNLTGKKLDPSTNLYYFNQRYYDPEIGRFLTPDPAGQALNPYLYCGNSPLAYIDPDGRTFFEAMTLMGAVYGAMFGGVGNMVAGGRFQDGAFGGAITGIKIGGIAGLITDGFTGGFASYNGNPIFQMAAWANIGAWSGQLGTMTRLNIPSDASATNTSKPATKPNLSPALNLNGPYSARTYANRYDHLEGQYASNWATDAIEEARVGIKHTWAAYKSDPVIRLFDNAHGSIGDVLSNASLQFGGYPIIGPVIESTDAAWSASYLPAQAAILIGIESWNTLTQPAYQAPYFYGGGAGQSGRW